MLFEKKFIKNCIISLKKDHLGKNKATDITYIQ